jgi:SAM-dependent methyltransferase
MTDFSEIKQRQKAMWALGDYPTIAEQIASAGEKAVEAAAISSGKTVLDVACGSGNATIPAAKAGAEVTGLDLTPELLEAAESRAAEAGVEITWVEGDAEALPFADGSFDSVISVFGCMFAPDHRRTAEELARVLGSGRLAVCAWTPESAIGRMFITVAGHLPPPPEGFQPPVLWGVEEHVREIFDATELELSVETESVHFEFDSVDAALADNVRDLPPLVAAKAALDAEGKWESLHDALRDMYADLNESGGETLSYDADYLVIKGSRPA